MSYDSASVVRPPLVGVGGWLAVFCVILLIVNPIATVITCIQIESQVDMVKSVKPAMGEVFDALMVRSCSISIALAFVSIMAGIMLVMRTSRAVAIAKAYVLCVPLAALFQFLFIPEGVTDGMKRAMTEGVIRDLVRSLVFFAIWFTYLCRSRRVRDTYTTPIKQRQVGPPPLEA